MEFAIDYAKKRKTFGSKIANFQAIQFKIAEMYQKIETSRLLVWKAAWESDNGMDPNISASVAKMYATEAANEVVDQALQIMAGYGYTRIFPIEKLEEETLAYARERQQFGRPIAGFQAIQFHLADMSTRIAAAEALTFAAAHAMDRGDKVSRLAAQAKLMAGETSVFCADLGVQIHGGYGLIKDYRAEKYYRDCKICTIGEGTSEIQRLVIARRILADS